VGVKAIRIPEVEKYWWEEKKVVLSQMGLKKEPK